MVYPKGLIVLYLFRRWECVVKSCSGKLGKLEVRVVADRREEAPAVCFIKDWLRSKFTSGKCILIPWVQVTIYLVDPAKIHRPVVVEAYKQHIFMR